MKYLTFIGAGNVSKEPIIQYVPLHRGDVKSAHVCLEKLHVHTGCTFTANFMDAISSREAYPYLITPKGIKAKIETKQKFLKNKQLEYDTLYNYLNE